MTEDNDKTTINTDKAKSPESNEEAKADAQETSAKGGLGGLLANKKVFIMGGGGLLLVILTVVMTMMFMGGDEAKATAEDQTSELAEADNSKSGHKETSDKDEANNHGASEDIDDSHGHDNNSDSKSQNSHTQQEDEEFEYEDPSAFEMDESEFDGLDFELSAEEMSALSAIEENLNFTDNDPSEGMPEPVERKNVMSIEDSLAEVDWLEAETNKLVEREEVVSLREKSVTKLEKEVARKILIIEQAESNRVAKLAKLYDGMDPRSVTKLMHNLDDDTVVSIISRMKQKNASQVLALLSPQRAARLSKKMITIAEN